MVSARAMPISMPCVVDTKTKIFFDDDALNQNSMVLFDLVTSNQTTIVVLFDLVTAKTPHVKESTMIYDF